jgi:Deacetylases, including yeast histone deacetylase and acetoin utilization protein
MANSPMMTIIFDEAATEYSQPWHPERPERLSMTESRFREVFPESTWKAPYLAEDKDILRVHSACHLRRLSQPQDFDTDTPYYEGIEEHARRAAGAAMLAAECALNGHKPFSLLRPPGHHATSDQAMGFCYLNSVAIAAMRALATGCSRVAIWDFDAHHGNGTEDIVRGHEQIRFASVHQYPGYPGTGTTSFENIYNWPVAPRTHREIHAAKVHEALDRLLEYRPDLVLVSAGFDAYREDPLTDLLLEVDDYYHFGHWLDQAGVPAMAILEGGYSNRLPELAENFIRGWNGLRQQ